MKKLSATLLMSMICTHVSWAEEITVDSYAVATPSVVTLVADSHTKPVVQEDSYAAPVIMGKKEDVMLAASAVAKPMQPTITAPRLSREEVARLHLSLIREQVEAESSSGGFSFFSSGSKIDETLLEDTNLFLSIYHDLPIAAEALFFKGRVQLTLGMEEAAAVSWLQVIYEFPESDIVFNAEQRMLLLLDKDWDDYAEQINLMLGQVVEGDRPTRLITLINLLYSIDDDKDVAAAVSQLQLYFLRSYPNHAHADEVQVLLAHNKGVESAKSGIYTFKKLLTLYPYSAYLAEARLAIADLQRTRLNEYENAVSSYRGLIEKYPTHKLTKNAYINLASTLEEDLRNYHEAIAVLQSIVALYPDEKVTLQALQTMAKLQRKEEDKPREAIGTLRKLATMFEGPEAISALEQALEIVDLDIQDPVLLIEVIEQLVRDFPDSEAAPEALFRMAEVLEASDLQKSKSLYRQFLNQYPQHRRASEAREKI
ncbi:MAG: tetratricopeptide repeat protein [Ghiorsea sp.]